MNFLRRFALIVYGLALLALVTVILMFPRDVARAIESISRFSSLERGIVTFVVDVLILLALYLLVRQVRPYSKDGLIVRASGALTDVSVDSARERILRAINAVPNVVSTDAKLQSVNGRADIALDVGVAGAHINVPDKQREIDRALRQVMLKQLGLQLASPPRVHIQLLSEQEPAPPREEPARSIIPPPTAEREEPLPHEELEAVQVTPPADAPPMPGELAQAPAEAEAWAMMRPSSHSIPEREPLSVVEEALAEDETGVVASVTEVAPAGIESDTATLPRVERVEPFEELNDPSAPLSITWTDQLEAAKEAEEAKLHPPIEPVEHAALEDIDPDYVASSEEQSSERPPAGLYDEGADLPAPDGDRKPPPVIDLD